jgi:hypothetical protein
MKSNNKNQFLIKVLILSVFLGVAAWLIHYVIVNFRGFIPN